MQGEHTFDPQFFSSLRELLQYFGLSEQRRRKKDMLESLEAIPYFFSSVSTKPELRIIVLFHYVIFDCSIAPLWIRCLDHCIGNPVGV